MNSTDSFVQKSALSLWKALVEKGTGFDGAIEAATTGMNDLFLLRSALDLWRALFANVKDVEDKINVAKAGMTIPNSNVSRLALDLWKALFEKGEGFADAQKCLSNIPRAARLKQIFEQLINEYKPKFEQSSLANIVPAVRQPAVAAQVPAAL
jgi:hypothetical protein